LQSTHHQLTFCKDLIAQKKLDRGAGTCITGNALSSKSGIGLDVAKVPNKTAIITRSIKILFAEAMSYNS